MEDFRAKGTRFEITSEKRAVDLFKSDSIAALSGDRLISAETDPELDRSSAIASLASDSPERFLDLVGCLPHLIQDIFFQYYLLGRTQTQIGQLLGCSQTKVWQHLRLGTEAMCAIIEFGGPPPILDQSLNQKAMKAYRALEKLTDHADSLTVREPSTLGQFDLSIDDSTFAMNFAPASTDGPC